MTTLKCCINLDFAALKPAEWCAAHAWIVFAVQSREKASASSFSTS